MCMQVCAHVIYCRLLRVGCPVRTLLQPSVVLLPTSLLPQVCVLDARRPCGGCLSCARCAHCYTPTADRSQHDRPHSKASRPQPEHCMPRPSSWVRLPWPSAPRIGHLCCSGHKGTRACTMYDLTTLSMRRHRQQRQRATHHRKLPWSHVQARAQSCNVGSAGASALKQSSHREKAAGTYAILPWVAGMVRSACSWRAWGCSAGTHVCASLSKHDSSLVLQITVEIAYITAQAVLLSCVLYFAGNSLYSISSNFDAN